MIIQLNPSLELNTPKGLAVCHFLRFATLEDDPLWGCFQEDGQIWWWPNWQVRAVRNFSAGRPDPEYPEPEPSVSKYKGTRRKGTRKHRA